MIDNIFASSSFGEVLDIVFSTSPFSQKGGQSSSFSLYSEDTLNDFETLLSAHTLKSYIPKVNIIYTNKIESAQKTSTKPTDYNGLANNAKKSLEEIVKKWDLLKSISELSANIDTKIQEQME